MRLLELFSGTGSVGRAFRDRGWDVLSLDIAPGRHQIRMDIMDWDYKAYDKGEFACIHASPPCTQYSIARTTAKTPRNLELADALVQRTLEIIEYLSPMVFFIENPFTGLLKTRPIMETMQPFMRRVTYCMYGMPYRKETVFWTNLGEAWKPQRCTAKNPCPMRANGRHLAVAQQGSSNRRLERITGFSRNDLYRIPASLCDELALATEIRISAILQATEAALETRLEREWDQSDPRE